MLVQHIICPRFYSDRSIQAIFSLIYALRNCIEDSNYNFNYNNISNSDDGGGRVCPLCEQAMNIFSFHFVVFVPVHKKNGGPEIHQTNQTKPKFGLMDDCNVIDNDNFLLGYSRKIYVLICVKLIQLLFVWIVCFVCCIICTKQNLVQYFAVNRFGFTRMSKWACGRKRSLQDREREKEKTNIHLDHEWNSMSAVVMWHWLWDNCRICGCCKNVERFVCVCEFVKWRLARVHQYSHAQVHTDKKMIGLRQF